MASGLSRQSKSRRAIRYLRAAMLSIALVLPMLSLMVLDSLWLWQNGLVLHWAAGALMVTTVAFAIERYMLRDAVTEASREEPENEVPTGLLTEREQQAWKAVLHLASNTKPGTIDGRDALLDLGKTTVETVARHMHPGDKDPLLKFTVPEVLALVARVSNDLAPFVRENIPLGDKLTVAQFIAIYRWRGIINIADKAFDLWRIVRLMNPASAMAQELRERFTRQLYDWGREELARKLTSAYIRDVGRAAIDLYSGRMRFVEGGNGTPVAVSDDDGNHAQSSPSAPVPKKPGSLRQLWSQTWNAGRMLVRRKSDDQLR